jgi:hypothetical protein
MVRSAGCSGRVLTGRRAAQRGLGAGRSRALWQSVRGVRPHAGKGSALGGGDLRDSRRLAGLYGALVWLAAQMAYEKRRSRLCKSAEHESAHRRHAR